MKKPSKLDEAARRGMYIKYVKPNVFVGKYPIADAGPRGLARDKGDKGGSCNFTACQRPNSAIYFNRSTQKYYCWDCANAINRVNRKDSLELYGHPDLCILEAPA